MEMTAQQLWNFLPVGYLISIAIETPLLIAGLSKSHPMFRRVMAGFWLTACTYPIVILVLPLTIWVHFGYWPYFVAAEAFALVAECFLFRAMYPLPPIRRDQYRDAAAIALANAVSCTFGFWMPR